MNKVQEEIKNIFDEHTNDSTLNIHKCLVNGKGGTMGVELFRFAYFLSEKHISRQLAEAVIEFTATSYDPPYPRGAAMHMVDKAYSKDGAVLDGLFEKQSVLQMKVQAELQRIRKLLGEIK